MVLKYAMSFFLVLKMISQYPELHIFLIKYSRCVGLERKGKSQMITSKDGYINQRL